MYYFVIIPTLTPQFFFLFPCAYWLCFHMAGRLNRPVWIDGRWCGFVSDTFMLSLLSGVSCRIAGIILKMKLKDIVKMKVLFLRIIRKKYVKKLQLIRYFPLWLFLEFRNRLCLDGLFWVFIFSYGGLDGSWNINSLLICIIEVWDVISKLCTGKRNYAGSYYLKRKKLTLVLMHWC